MNTAMTVEISLTVVLSIIALSLSAYSIMVAKRRSDNNDMKEATSLLTELKTKMETVVDSTKTLPGLSEQIAAISQNLKDLDRRVTRLEQK